MIEEYLLIIDVSDFLRLQGGEGAPPLHDHDHRLFIDPDFAAVLPPQPLPCLQLHQHPAVYFCQSRKKSSAICGKAVNILFVL
jgi:hypothetical protein